jgi:hypothetical protein
LTSGSVILAAIYAGLQGLFAVGAHSDIAGTQRGIAAGALIETGGDFKRLGFRLEGIPPVSLPQGPSTEYGQATPQLSLLNGAVRFAIAPARRLWFGLGETIINQRTPLPNLDQVAASRLAGLRYELTYRAPLHGGHFLELIAGAAPHLTGADRYTYSIPHPEVDKPEVAAEEDVQIAWGIATEDAQWLAGFRSIGFSARFSATGEASDRNNGAGVIVEWRRFLRR